MIYFDACALLKFVKPEKETEALRGWRAAVPDDTLLVTSELASLEIGRTLRRAGVDRTQLPYYVEQATLGLHLLELTGQVMERAATIDVPRLGTLDALHLATVQPFTDLLTAFVTYDHELAVAAATTDLPVLAPG